MSKKSPELRFKGFTDDWEQRKLGELALVLTGFPFKNEDFVDNGKYLVITNGNIQNESSTVDVSLGNRIDDLSDEIKERYCLNKNDILVTMDGTVGRTAKVVDDNLILAQRVARLVANKNTEFVYQWLNQGSFFNEMTKVSHGGTIKHISLNEISNYSAKVPSNNIEQQKIGSFFKHLDDTIALHQRKLDLLKEQKKGFLQKMFPKNGAKVPELRFAGFADDWEERKLSELATMNARIGWQNLRTSEFLDNGDYMLITGTDFKDGAIDYSNVHYVEKERFEQDKKIQISNKSILITKDGTIGKVAYVEGLTMPATLNAGVFNVKVKEELVIDSKYLFHYLNAPFLLKFAEQRSTGGTIKHLNQNVLVEFPIPLPSLGEQHKIAELLSNFDKTIALHQRKLDLLKEQKKGFLQKMFV
ncbi:restriction endonuclease subunit S [Streptococcus thermophilus]|nr:restriction endonuclease subunit S [Streptococcus thermophilus]MCE2216962.1 restriction endonuclease subunit S [Streptococcus thermophilus]MCE2219455.1 restriction endonuclease subunit S [Streptococcus thermophilus]MCE2262629.1 restriction endonuclease subunit S [Streptococcus thermophilus]